MQQLTLAQTAKWLKNCKDAYILIHRSPDGDCIGAGYALAEMLHQMQKRAVVLCDDPIPERYHFMLPENQKQETFQPGCVIAVDVADPKLLGGEVKEKYGDSVDLCIDHHISNVPFASARYLDGKAAATCEILYSLYRILPVAMTKTMALCLYTGMATDTGCFQYDNAGPRTHRAVADLMEMRPDVPYAKINRQMFAVKSFGRLRLEQLLIDQLERYMDGKCVLICITQEFLQKFQVDDAELDGIAGFPLQVEGAQVGITMKEKEPGKFRISMRSADQVNVSAICQRLGGGGHVKAAGCLVCGTADEAREKLLRAVSEGWNVQ
ncbi:bifunctional oligoribonuclease/PAP phosphatase NrnA [Ruminococcus sp.]|uniref:DHH family phosphoesterase n=1 Tax=Ruminococcus sp. TaxID=41978 RepID=UPI0025D4E579|nr:bifunctional oligoribonuclease/PAP phosphatase NrnA [Ruminococcus sp.]